MKDRLPASRAPSPPAAAPPARAAAPALLRLQGAIGNRATRSLMRRPALQAAGVSAGTRVSGSTAGLMQAAIAESTLLRPHLRGKPDVSKGPLKLHDFDVTFERAYRDLGKDRDNAASGDVEKALKGTRGFYHRKSDTIHLRPASTFGHALHEAMHRLSVVSFAGFYGHALDEGVTQYFADCVLREQGLAPASHEYGDELACAKRLVRFTSFELVARAYFSDHSQLTTRLGQRLGETKRWRTDVCAHLPA